ncbi:MAG: hypothetical protein HFH54_01605 [Lachnospiraceae bacterium]|jgi:hypothetical protein|nr:hypothetical protein [Lachnospiraceae bacterium]
MTERQRQKRDRYKKRLDMYYAAEEAVLLNQEYRIGTRSLKRADLAAIRAEIDELEDEIAELEESGGKRYAGRFLPRDI